ncbi:MAG: hypothetical protein R2704_03265 [Microthrixaceae bacterium]
MRACGSWSRRHFDGTVRYSEVGQAMLRLARPGRTGARLLGELLDEFTGGRELEQSALETLLAELLERADVGPWCYIRCRPWVGSRASWTPTRRTPP